MRALRRAADALTGFAALVATIGLVFEVVVILADVAGRALHAPLTGAQDLSQMTMVIVVFGAMALCDRQGGHVAVDILEPAFPAWLNRACDIAWAAAGAVIFTAIAWAVLDSAALSRMLNLSTNILHLPKDWFQTAMAGLCLIAAFGMALRAAERMLGGREAR
ncbi:TRAP transporter small permease [Mangrovicoccus algicola]|uniref:TRAP transporter small permease protein n=1 Tax=Mangrovicoccus algicola TaxID=2771008 RepID=A0A8J6YWM8_9RHOB|nr:TRAP transporter small permease [Mangrovicoccus algicola]MBE3639250.1 TRAP transporter small permease [Mangrovicoccus algicola]